MRAITTDIEGVLIIEPQVFEDARGYFFESYSKRKFDKLIGEVNFVQDNESRSTYGVVRGLHFQKPPHTQAKLVRCVRGKVLDIAVDIRKDSPTFGRHIAVELSEENHRMLFIPRGFAHGFAVLSDEAVFQYKCDNYYCPESEAGIAINDEALNIELPFPTAEAIFSEKDKMHPMLDSFEGI